MSGCDDVRDNSPVVGKIRDAMAECLDLGESIVCQKESISKCDVSRSGGRTSTGCRLHRQWHDSINNAPVASIPLKSGDRCIAVVSMKRHFGELFTNEGINKLGTLLQPYAPALDLVDRANRSALRHATESLRRTVYNFLRPSRWASKVVVLSILALGAWLGFGTMEYTVTSPCVIVPAQSRHFCTPHQAKLNKARVVAGDAVKQGDILCEFDTQTLRMEKIRLEAGINIAKINQSIAMAEGSPSEAELAGAEIRKLRADLDIIETKISQAIVRAPFDGVITSGDHRQSIGEILPQGQPLFVLSSQQGWTLRMKVSESQIESIREDLTGCFASKAKPEDLQDFRIVRISPSAEQHDKRNIYIVEAHLNSPPQWVRAGMEGFAKVQTGKRAAWWVLFHNLIDGIRMKLWL
jgi:hypothetical protein